MALTLTTLKLNINLNRSVTTGIFLLILAGIFVLTWSTYRANNTIGRILDKDAQMAALRLDIIRLDELLTHYARAAASASVREDADRFSKRYEELVVELDTALARARLLAPPEVEKEIDAKTNVANQKLIEMERKNFELVKAGEFKEARLIMYSPEYDAQKRIYASGMQTLYDFLENATVEMKLERERMMTISFFVFGIILLCFVGIIYIYRNQLSLLNHVREAHLSLSETHEQLIATEEEIRQNAEELTATNDHLTATQRKLEQVLGDLHDSIHYASRIQRSLLPDLPHIKAFSHKMILWEPRDVVSGDFYWCIEKQSYVYFAAADCTGHGVPGALLSVLSIAELNDVLNKEGTPDAHLFLSKLNQSMIARLNAEGKKEKINDGLDVALLRYDTRTGELQYSGANMPLLLFRDGQINEVAADKYPIGHPGLTESNERVYTLHTFTPTSEDRIFLCSDGFQDQFGGEPDSTERRKKFTRKKLLQLLEETAKLPGEIQKAKLGDEFNRWKGNHPQTDDLLIVGLRK